MTVSLPLIHLSEECLYTEPASGNTRCQGQPGKVQVSGIIICGIFGMDVLAFYLRPHNHDLLHWRDPHKTNIIHAEGT